MRKTEQIVFYSAGHFWVDLMTVSLLYTVWIAGDISLIFAGGLFLLYNVAAFALQAVFGYMTDGMKRPQYIAALGCAAAAGSAVFTAFPVVAVCVAGLGNALYHVGGGVATLRIARGKASLPGVFVAPGAMGLFLGPFIAQWGVPLWPIAAGLAGFGAICMLPVLPLVPGYPVRDRMALSTKALAVPALLCLLLSVSVRAFSGAFMTLPWKQGFWLPFMAACAVVLGKGAGGFLADAIGWRKMAAGALILAAPLLAWGGVHPAVGMAGIFLLNTTMAVTLAATARLLPGFEGFAFGLTTLALLIGALPSFTPLNTARMPWMVPVIMLGAALMLLYGLKDLPPAIGGKDQDTGA
jgi:FSR family fosmidomycin resistance protein-like MFS transporter